MFFIYQIFVFLRFALTIRDLSPHFLMLIDCIDLPIEFVLLVMFLGYKFNIWKAITVTAATGKIIVCSVMMTIYFNENRNFFCFFFCSFGSKIGCNLAKSKYHFKSHVKILQKFVDESNIFTLKAITFFQKHFINN